MTAGFVSDSVSERLLQPGLSGLLHIDILNGKLWIQQDGTEAGIAEELVAVGIPKSHIVLAFKSAERRRLTEFAVS